jgi:hypothetical protein
MIQTTISATGQPALLLEPKDLRIGNILLYKGKYVHITTLSLDIDDEYEETIGFCDLGKLSNEITDWNRSLIADLQPTPLTPELLEKCGFEKRNNVYSNGNMGFEVVSLKSGGEMYLVPNALYCIDIKYLHQLQNLYFTLTGKELDITL